MIIKQRLKYLQNKVVSLNFLCFYKTLMNVIQKKNINKKNYKKNILQQKLLMVIISLKITFFIVLILIYFIIFVFGTSTYDKLIQCYFKNNFLSKCKKFHSIVS